MAPPHELASGVAAHAGPEVAIVGTLATGNLGIERLVRNAIATAALEGDG